MCNAGDGGHGPSELDAGDGGRDPDPGEGLVGLADGADDALDEAPRSDISYDRVRLPTRVDSMLESPGESGEEHPPLELGAGHSRYPNLRGAPPGLPAGAPLVMHPYEENTIMDQVKEKWMGSAILAKKKL